MVLESSADFHFCVISIFFSSSTIHNKSKNPRRTIQHRAPTCHKHNLELKPQILLCTNSNSPAGSLDLVYGKERWPWVPKKMVATIAVPSPKSSILQKQNPVSLRDPNCSFLGGSSLKQLKPRNKRRDADHAISLVVPSASLATNTPTTTTTTNRGGRFYFNFTGFPFPLGPFLNRSTIRTEVCFFAFNFNLFILMFLLASFLYFFFVFSSFYWNQLSFVSNIEFLRICLVVTKLALYYYFIAFVCIALIAVSLLASLIKKGNCFSIYKDLCIICLCSTEWSNKFLWFVICLLSVYHFSLCHGFPYACLVNPNYGFGKHMILLGGDSVVSICGKILPVFQGF